MRRVRRRRPAGQAQVPEEPAVPLFVVRPTEPAIVRLAPDRTVVDPIWGCWSASLALVWLDEPMGTWARAVWPIEPVSRRFIAPSDLHVGHAIEVASWARDRWLCAYGWIADADAERFVVVPGTSASEAFAMARRAFDVWHTAAIAEVEEAWRDRLARARGADVP